MVRRSRDCRDVEISGRHLCARPIAAEGEPTLPPSSRESQFAEQPPSTARRAGSCPWSRARAKPAQAVHFATPTPQPSFCNCRAPRRNVRPTSPEVTRPIARRRQHQSPSSAQGAGSRSGLAVGSGAIPAFLRPCGRAESVSLSRHGGERRRRNPRRQPGRYRHHYRIHHATPMTSPSAASSPAAIRSTCSIPNIFAEKRCRRVNIFRARTPKNQRVREKKIDNITITRRYHQGRIAERQEDRPSQGTRALEGVL